MKMIDILFNGCSYTNGCELKDPLENRYSSHVRNYFDIKIENISTNNACNDGITRNTLEWFENGNSCKLAIIQLTYKFRVEFYDLETKQYVTSRLVRGNKTYSEAQYNNWETYYKLFYNHQMGTDNFHKNQYLLEQYFKNKNIPFIFIRSVNQQHKQNSLWKDLCEIKLEDIKPMFYGFSSRTPFHFGYGNDISILGTKEKYPEHFLDCHFSELGHQKIANYLIEKILDTKIFK